MRNALLDAAEKTHRRGAELEFDIGDTVVVTIRIVEGEKERLQDFEGTVIARKGRGLSQMFTVRKIVANEGVERTFPLHSPKVAAIKTLRKGRIRRAKLYFLRGRVGKSRKLRERRVSAEAKKAAAEAKETKTRVAREATEAASVAKAAAGKKALAATTA